MKMRIVGKIVAGAVASALLLGGPFAMSAQADTGWGKVKSGPVETTDTGWGKVK